MAGVGTSAEHTNISAEHNTKEYFNLCFVEVFDIWKRKSDPPFTWATIVEALRSPIVSKNKLAKEIEDWLK